MKNLSIVLISLGILVIVVGCVSSGDERAVEAAEDIVSADPERYTVEFENDLLRVLRISYGPGEESVAHGHPAGCGVVIRGGEFGFRTQSGEIVTGRAVPHSVNCTDAEVHTPINLSDAETEFVFFDLKNRATFDNENDPRRRGGVTSHDGVPDALAASPHRYFQRFENDDVRLLRVQYPVDGTARTHSHPAHCAIYLTGGTYTFTSGTGEARTLEVLPGQVECRDAEVHASENIGGSDGLVLMLEMKDRARLGD